MEPARLVSALGVLAALVAACACEEAPSKPAPRAFVGRETCASCHEAQDDLWRGSHHDLAMQEATEATVLGDFDDASFTYAGVTSRFFRSGEEFFIRTDGSDGELANFAISYTFGIEPLQQYLVELAGGRLQALSVVWDTRPEREGGQRWFHLYPDDAIDHRDPLHWTGRFQNWNFMCASCHSTNLRKSYRAEDRVYETTWSEVDVSCEACHGPGSSHVHWAETEDAEDATRGLVVTLGDDDGGVWEMDMATGLSQRVPPRSSRAELDTCAPCHSRRSTIADETTPGDPFLDGYRPALLDEVLYHPDGQILDEVYVYGSFVQSKMYREGVTCQDCHDPHSLSVRAEGNAVCASCHLAERFDSPEHHFHETDSEAARCVACHMPATRYMVVDARRDHSFRVPRPDLSLSTGSPNACTGCHEDRTDAWAMKAVVERHGPDREPHFGEVIDAGRHGLPGAIPGLEALAVDGDEPGIARATALELLGRSRSPSSRSAIETSLRDGDPLVRVGALMAARSLDPSLRHQLVFPLLDDAVRTVRIEAARVLASVPREVMTPAQREKLARGLEEYRAAQLVNGDWPEAHVNLGVLESELGDATRAESAYRAALRLDPLLARAYVNLSDLYRSRGRDDDGERLLREGLERIPERAELHHSLGLLLVRGKRLEEAIGPLEQAAELRPDVSRYAYVYAVALRSAGGKEEAVRRLEDAHERHPTDPEILFALVSFHREDGRLASALRYARRLQTLAPEDPRWRQLVAALEAQR